MRGVEDIANDAEILGENPTPVPSVDGVKIAWAMPNYGPIFSQVYCSHLAAIAYASRFVTIERLGSIPMVGATDRMYIHSACNHIVKEAMAAEMDYIFWTESDMILPVDTLPKLLALKKSIASGIYFLRGGTGQPCLYMKTPVEVKENPYLHTPITIYDERAPFKVHCPGMGCVLMEMDVFKKIEEPWFDLKASGLGKKDGYGQDLYFYTKVRWAGIEVWAHPGVLCDQIDIEVVGYADYRKRLLDKKSEFGGFLALDGSNKS